MTPDPISGHQGGDFAFPTEQEMAGLPDRSYRVQVATSELATAKTSGAIMWKLKLEVIEPTAYAGKFVFDNVVFSHGAAGITFGKLKALGLAVQAGHPFNPSGGAHRDLIGRKVEITTKLEEFNGQMSPKVARMHPDPGPGGLKEVAGASNRTASAASPASGVGSSSSSPVQRSNPPSEKMSSDELPF